MESIEELVKALGYEEVEALGVIGGLQPIYYLSPENVRMDGAAGLYVAEFELDEQTIRVARVLSSKGLVETAIVHTELDERDVQIFHSPGSFTHYLLTDQGNTVYCRLFGRASKHKE